VALPLFLATELGWSFTGVGTFFALWVIGYGAVQALSPQLLKSGLHDGKTVANWAFALSTIPVVMAWLLSYEFDAGFVVIGGLALFGVVFAINSAVHSYLIVAWSDYEKVSMNVGFYYMANAGGRLVGTVFSGVIYQIDGLTGCLLWSAGFVLAAALLSLYLPRQGAAA